MSSTYGESVKFYERISDLHGQLKTYEEEQYNLQEELDKLWARPSRPMEEVDRNCGDQEMTQFPPESATMYKREAELLEDDKRRHRNQFIMEKIKELESNASVFAARSEKLRIMRSEYDTLMKKYMASRKLSNLNYSSTYGSQPNLVRSNSNDQLLTEKSYQSAPAKVSTGVNTDITGPIRSVLDQPPVFRPNPELYSQDPSNNKNINFTQQPFPDYFNAKPENGYYFGLPGIAASNGERTMQEKDEELKTNQESNYSRYHPTIFGDHVKVLPVSLDRREKDQEESITDKLRHNVYFDLSTTSESEVTSTKPLSTKKKMMPMSINLDDTTTQSETFSLSTHIPTKLQTKARAAVPPNLLNMALTSDASDSTARSSYQQQQQKQKQKEPQMPENHRTAISNEVQNTISSDELEHAKEPSNTKETTRNMHVQENEENDLELTEDSESLTTSPGDSVMDSVQNRTLNESLPHEVEVNLIPTGESLQRVLDGDYLGIIKTKENTTNRRDSVEKTEPVKVHDIPESRITVAVEPSGGSFQQEILIGETKNERKGSQNPFLVKPTQNPMEVLNNFTKIEDEFTLGNNTMEEIESWDKNTISMDNNNSHMNIHEQSPEKLRKEAFNTDEFKNHSEEKPVVVSTGSAKATQEAPKATTTNSSNTGTVSASRRVRIKLDYEDSDSDLSEKPAKDKLKETNDLTTKAGANPPRVDDNTLDKTDDDFDDFFDI